MKFTASITWIEMISSYGVFLDSNYFWKCPHELINKLAKSSGAEQVVDVPPWGWEPDALDRICRLDQDVPNFFQESIPFIFWTLFEEEVEWRRVRAPWQ
jgi:hypothetical protein